jgi:alpha-galactosidase
MHFACTVAMSARFGMDLDLNRLPAADKAVCAGAIAAYKEIRDVTLPGDLYRLEDPHDHYRGAINFVSPDKSRAVVFAFQLKDGPQAIVHPEGLVPTQQYTLHELNPAPGRAAIPQEGQTMAGEALMRDGITPSCAQALEACAIELRPGN